MIARNEQNRACVRVLLACSLAKVYRSDLDIRKPYTEIGTTDSYSGRSYDEQFITAFINKYSLPCNSTTAFLTPALRNRNVVLTPEVNLMGRPPKLYQAMLRLLGDVHEQLIDASSLLAETVRWLVVIREQNYRQLEALLASLRANEEAGAMPLSVEGIVKLIGQHLLSEQASRLPVLVVAAIYKAASENLGERVLPLLPHSAADEQTGALGDLEITLLDDHNVITAYEMKFKRVTIEDINRALQKLNGSGTRIANYIFITTELIEESVEHYAASLYAKTGGIEIAVLDCLSFLRHFLHLFHRLRVQFLEEYQTLLLTEPESAVRQSLKEAFLTLRRAAETATTELREIAHQDEEKPPLLEEKPPLLIEDEPGQEKAP